MILAIDIGNTHVVLGIFKDRKLLISIRLQSLRERTVDEFALEVLSLFSLHKLNPSQISQIVISSVVPPLTRVFVKLSQKYLNNEPLVVSSQTDSGIEILLHDPTTLGADRLVNAVAARSLFGQPVVIVDFGTATTFDVVGITGAYEGGLIAPGVMVAANALFEKAAMLTKIDLHPPLGYIAKNTEEALNGGIVYGSAALVDGIILRIKEQLNSSPEVVATGGLASLVAPESREIRRVVPELTLEGLRIIAERNLVRV